MRVSSIQSEYGQTPVGEHWRNPSRIWRLSAIWAPISDAQVEHVDAPLRGQHVSVRSMGKNTLGA